MSWASYVESLTVPGSAVRQAAIVGLDGSLWAMSQGISPSIEEIRRLIGGFQKPSSFLVDGIHWNSSSYFYIRNTDRSVVGKSGEEGLFATRCNKCIIVAVFSGPPQLASVAVEPVADYLIQVGY